MSASLVLALVGLVGCKGDGPGSSKPEGESEAGEGKTLTDASSRFGDERQPGQGGTSTDAGQPGETDHEARGQRAQDETQTMAAAMMNFIMDVGRCATEEEGLEALLRRPHDLDRWNGPYVKDWQAIPRDPWGNPYAYYLEVTERGRENVCVISYGADGQPGGTGFCADIVNGHVVESDD